MEWLERLLEYKPLGLYIHGHLIVNDNKDNDNTMLIHMQTIHY